MIETGLLKENRITKQRPIEHSRVFPPFEMCGMPGSRPFDLSLDVFILRIDELTISKTRWKKAADIRNEPTQRLATQRSSALKAKIFFFKLYSLSNFQINNIVLLLTIVAILYFTSTGLIYNEVSTF